MRSIFTFSLCFLYIFSYASISAEIQIIPSVPTPTERFAEGFSKGLSKLLHEV
jgi:hypothetical protein